MTSVSPSPASRKSGYDAEQSQATESRMVRDVHYFFPPPRPKLFPMLPSPRPPSNLSIPRPPSRPLTSPPRPKPLRSLPTKPRTPLRSRPTAAMIWKSGSLKRYQSGLSSFFACGISASFFLAFSIVVTMVEVSSLRELASWCSSFVASPDAARAFAFCAILPSGSRPRIAPLHSCRIRLPSSILGLTCLTSSSSSSSSLGLRSAASMSYIHISLELG